MSEQTTYRFFVDNKRVATAIFWKTGSKHMSPILEVFPRQTTILPSGRPLMAIFHSEEEWRKHCLEEYVPKQKSRVETVTKKKSDPKLDKVRPYRLDDTEAITHRFFVGDNHMATAVVYGRRILQVSPRLSGSRMFDNLETWTKYCEKSYNPQPVTRFEVTKKEVKELPPAVPTPVTIVHPSPSPLDKLVQKDFETFVGALNNRIAEKKSQSSSTPAFKPNKYWICPACNLGPGNDHRMCICRAYNFSVEKWEIAVGLHNPNTTPLHQDDTEEVQREDWSHKETHKTTIPPGKYYIGDLCYALSDTIYDTVFGNIGEYDSGFYKNNKNNDFFMVDNTAYGDGCYIASDGKEFCVDAGIIGVCPASMIGKGTGHQKDGEGGHIYEFKDPVKCRFKSGVFTFKSESIKLVINTTDEGDDEEY